jgi:PAS domain S-box-containing protein
MIENGGINNAGDARTPVFNLDSIEQQIAVLLVDDNMQLLDLTATFLKRERDEFDVETVTCAKDGLAYVAEHEVDAIVSDYEMPGLDGLEFLERVREDSDIPFILFTGKGSEQIASEAISRGVTDYLQKKSDTSQYSLLANRIVNAVERHRKSKQLERSQEKFSKLVTNSSDVLGIVNENAEFRYISPVCEDLLGYKQHEIIGEVAFGFMPPEDRENAMNEFYRAIEHPESEPVIEHHWEKKNGELVPFETRGKNMFDDEFINGFVVNGRDISDHKEHQQQIEAQNERLTEMHQALSHDIKNPLQVASNSVNLYRETAEDQYLKKIEDALDRIDVLVKQILTMTEQETNPRNPEQVSLRNVATQAWSMTDTESAKLAIDGSKEFEADKNRLQRVFENLFDNAVEHSDGDVTISVGPFDQGIYIEDDGPGIPAEKQSNIFESGYTTKSANTGYGLDIVEQIVDNHGWDIELQQEARNGARFEITNIEFKSELHH